MPKAIIIKATKMSFYALSVDAVKALEESLRSLGAHWDKYKISKGTGEGSCQEPYYYYEEVSEELYEKIGASLDPAGIVLVDDTGKVPKVKDHVQNVANGYGQSRYFWHLASLMHLEAVGEFPPLA